MLIATVEKVNGNWYLMNFMDINSFEDNIIENQVMCDHATQNHYVMLKNKYSIISIKEEDIQRGSINTDSFIFSESFTSDQDQLSIDKAILLKRMDFAYNGNLRGINFMEYINYIHLFNYFASKGIFITAENKEDKYIEILELDDEEAITKLEEYLNIQEVVDPFLKNMKDNILLKEEIEYANAEEFQILKEKIV